MACRWQRGCRDAIALIPVTARPGPRAPCGWLVALPSPLSPGDAHHREQSSTRAGHPAGRLLAARAAREGAPRLPRACWLTIPHQNLATSVWKGSATLERVCSKARMCCRLLALGTRLCDFLNPRPPLGWNAPALGPSLLSHPLVH